MLPANNQKTAQAARKERSLNEWHLDRRVPIALILVLAIQAVTVVWMFATLTAQVQQNSARLAKLPDTFPPVQWVAKMARLESEIGHLRRSVDGLNRTLRRYGSRGIIPGGGEK